MKRPIIGLTMNIDQQPDRYELQTPYVISIEKAGGLPLAIPHSTNLALIPQILDLLDGILFVGGDDLDPAIYGQPWHPNAVPIDPRRQTFELALLADVEHRRLPTLGICLGSQLINVHRGGSLHQFLPDLPRPNPIEHRKAERDRPTHPVTVALDSQIGRAIGKPNIIANTYHKQSVDRIGRNLRVVATAPDAIIEAFEDPDMPLFAAIQWHPERLHDLEEHLALFKLLVHKAAEFAMSDP